MCASAGQELFNLSREGPPSCSIRRQMPYRHAGLAPVRVSLLRAPANEGRDDGIALDRTGQLKCPARSRMCVSVSSSSPSRKSRRGSSGHFSGNGFVPGLRIGRDDVFIMPGP